ncbi:MAG: helix-turn-helix transcriptional regulator [Clostridia bacterium]|nr:helix-turn-helix transcriptional regulator [Clostridia bacterium]
MKLKIGETIRRLRHERGCTQEQLARAVGVSAQAVSRWEAGTGYPDIEYIPAVADFFDISTDILFGYTDSREHAKAVRTECAVRESAAAGSAGDYERSVEILRGALSEFPMSDVLRLHLAGALVQLGMQRQDRSQIKTVENGQAKINTAALAANPALSEAVEIFERLLADGVKGDIRHAVTTALGWLYPVVGMPERFVRLAEMQEPLMISREVLLSQCGEGDTRAKNQGEALLALMSQYILTLTMALGMQSETDGWENCICSIEAMMDGLIPDGRCGRLHFELSTFYYVAGRLAKKHGNTALFEVIEEKRNWHAEAYRAACGTGEYRYTAPLLRQIVHNSNQWGRLPDDGRFYDNFSENT